MNEFAKLQFDSQSANGPIGLYNGKRVLFQKHGRTILPHDRTATRAVIGQDPVLADARYTLTTTKGHVRVRTGGSNGPTAPTNRSLNQAGAVVSKSGGRSLTKGLSAARLTSRTGAGAHRVGSVSGVAGNNIFNGTNARVKNTTLQNRMKDHPGGTAFLNKMMTQGQHEGNPNYFGDRSHSVQPEYQTIQANN